MCARTLPTYGLITPAEGRFERGGGRSPRALRGRAIAAAVAIAASLAVQAGAAAQVDSGTSEPADDDPDRYRLVKRFDFDERKLGNFETTPMYWRRLEGLGLPFFNSGQFDEAVGRDAPPSFRLAVRTGNVAFEYDHYDLTVIPSADYFIEGYVRTAGLAHSRAFMAAYFVDRYGERIAGSERISRLVGGDEDSGWVRVWFSLQGEFPNAYALRIQCWILHRFVWSSDPSPPTIDPIIRQDVDGVAWFDDISVYRLPRARLQFSNPAAVVAPGAEEALLIDVNNASPEGLSAELSITDTSGVLWEEKSLYIEGIAALNHGASDADAARGRTNWDRAEQDEATPSRAVRSPLPELPPGNYVATLALQAEGRTLLSRRLSFAVLPRLPRSSVVAFDTGVDLGLWRAGDIRGAIELVRQLGVGAAKIGVPMLGPVDSLEKSRYFAQISELARRLAEYRVDAAAVMMSPPADHDEPRPPPIRELVSQDSSWPAMVAPVLAQFGGVFTAWQLGDERAELRDAGDWSPRDIDAVRELLESFMTFPRLIVPRSLSAPEPTDDGDAISVFVDSATPTPAMLRMLEFLTINSTQDRWLRLDAPDGSPLSGQARLATFAQRLILCKSLDPHRLYVPAPFEVSIESGAPHWRPTRDYIPWRTMLTFLAGKKAVGVLHPAEGVRAIVFDGAGGSCLFAWSQSAGGVPREFDAYLGNDARGIDLWGNDVTLASRDRRRRVPVGPVPIIVYDIDAPVLLLEASFRFEPRFVQIHKPEPRPILRFRNTGGARMAGELIIQVPDDWRVKPARDTFALDPGEEYRREVQITLPPRQLARDYQLLVELRLSAPEPRTLRFPVDLRVGLDGVDVYAVAWFEGDDLVVEQTLRNLSDEHVSFTAFCEPPGRRRLDSAFRDIGPGQTVRRTYVFPASRDLADAWLHYGVREIHGDRSLDLVVKAPH